MSMEWETEQLEVKKITDYEAIPILKHEKKGQILKLLIDEELNLITIANKMKLNPGTVWRYIADLLRLGLVIQSEPITNMYGQKEIYYRAAAKQFHIMIDFLWPTEE